MESYKHTEEFLWLKDRNHRYVIGQIKEKPLIVIGLNPSIATPSLPDRTYCKILTIANNKKNRFDSIIVFNLYPYINKEPEKLLAKFDKKVSQKNINIINDIIKHIAEPTVLCAWGAGIERKKRLTKNLEEIYNCFPTNTVWKRIDKSKFKHPQHPLYAKENTKFQNFNIKKYLEKINSKY